MPAPETLVQTTYAELLERCSAADFRLSFPQQGSFVSKLIKDKRYWYFQEPASEGKAQKYVGPETPELLDLIRRHQEMREDEAERRALISTLIRSFGSPRPSPQGGAVVAALATAGVFRLRGVLIGTTAFQTYPPMLAASLPGARFRTEDVDIAQFRSISVAVADETPPMLDVLKQVDPTFSPVPHQVDGRKVTRYQTDRHFRVDFLTPNEGADTSKPQRLPALRTDAEPLRFLDFLIRDPEPAVVLHGAGIAVLVPQPERFALHKLIVSRRRSSGNPKRDKDLRQAETLLDVLVQKRPFELAQVWHEAYDRGRTWRQLLVEGLAVAVIRPRDLLLRTIEQTRSLLPGVNLIFSNPPARYDFDRDVVVFEGQDTLGGRVQCAISREALEDHFDADDLEPKNRVRKFLDHRSEIEALARSKYLSAPVEEPGSVLIRTEDVPLSRAAQSKTRRS
ncbi:MAG TPA: GSU2403 family nucleotidyltransferase fold protein [Rhizomicrobium sp.]|nr:GSU2403 family nucleotidyltransferase fold protein [Rhizomicrobium sp.]